MLKLYLCRATILAVLIIFASSMFGAIFQFSTCARMFQPQKKHSLLFEYLVNSFIGRKFR